MVPKQVELIKDLIDKTHKGSIAWTTTEADDQFALRLKRGVILFDKEVDSFAVESLYNYVITIVNNEGKQVDRIRQTLRDPWYEALQALHEDIHRRVFKIDEQLDEIIKDLSG